MFQRSVGIEIHIRDLEPSIPECCLIAESLLYFWFPETGIALPARHSYLPMTTQAQNNYRRKYDISRHHAWAGLGFLSVALALRYLFPSLPNRVSSAAILILIVYILFWLSLTYRYRSGLREESPSERMQAPLGKERVELDKIRLKLEKKRSKANYKLYKKGGS